MGGPRAVWNGNYVTAARHYYHDFYRYPKSWQKLGAKWPFVFQQLDRIPNIFKGAIVGAAYGTAGKVIADGE
jgi:hypothetical protein